MSRPLHLAGVTTRSWSVRQGSAIARIGFSALLGRGLGLGVRLLPNPQPVQFGLEGGPVDGCGQARCMRDAGRRPADVVDSSFTAVSGCLWAGMFWFK